MTSLVCAGSAEEALSGGMKVMLLQDEGLEGELEVEVGDAEAVAEVEGVGLVAGGSGVEAEGGAALLAGVLDEPLEHGFAVTLGAGVLIGDEVVDVEGFTAPEDVLEAEASDGDDCVLVLEEGEVVALGLLGADAGDEVGEDELGTQLVHDEEAAGDVGVGLGESDVGHDLPTLPGAEVSDVGDVVA